jgi:hypothetical protein
MIYLISIDHIYYYLSRVVAFVHLLYVLFVFLGILFIYVGWMMKFNLIRNFYFRVIHLLAMIVVAIQQYYMINCPLTILEKKLLVLAGKPTYQGAFVAHLMNTYNLNIKTELYLPLYVGLSLIFLLSFILIPPKLKRNRKQKLILHD